MQTSIFSKYLKLLLIIILAFNFSSTYAAGDLVRASNGMVVTASPLASKVGLHILKRGGNAVDAAVAVGFALAVTYPVAGNIGGGGFMVIHTADGKNITIDYREKAPLKAFRDMFLDEEGNYRGELSTEGILASGVPGSVAGLLYALENYGTMSLKEVIQPSINLAEDGFQLDYATAHSFNVYFESFKEFPSTLKIFSRNGEKYQEGNIFKQPDLASTLKRIRDNGKKGFYEGETADLIVKQFRNMGGLMTHEDLLLYHAVEREPLVGHYRGYKIVSMGPPSSGGVALIQMLNILENDVFTKKQWGSSSYLHKLTESMKYAYADRAEYLGDPDFTEVPKGWLISKNYGRELFNKITDRAVPSDSIRAGKLISESTETTHYSVIDSKGNAVSVTTTINSGYGSKVVVEGAGFLLNNEMDDFSAKPGVPNQFGLLGSEANSIVPGKRMLSSMTPTIVLKDDKPYLIAGSPGGSTIMTVVLQVVLNVLDFNMNIRDAVNAPRIHHQWYPDRIDYEPFGMSSDIMQHLSEIGQNIGNERKLGLVEGILIDSKNKIIYGTSDIRGHGSAEGY
jgi:gamma-glutamyltranspeptidase / glutathione hydrolase